MTGERSKVAVKSGDDEDSVPAALVQEISPLDESAPVGPSSEEEAAFLAVDGDCGPADIPPPKANRVEPDSVEAPLPPMEDLVNRIPAPARELMEQLFRTHFVTVKRIPKSALK